MPNCIAVIGEALAILRNDLGLSGEIVVADNGSTDGSQALARDLGARVVDVAEKGYGAALRGGFAAARGRYLVMGDADGSYDFREAIPMISALSDGADLCMGSRFKGGVKKGCPCRGRIDTSAAPPAHRNSQRALPRQSERRSLRFCRALTADCFHRVWASPALGWSSPARW